MMDESAVTPFKDDPGNSPPEELTKEKLITKCKNLLTIAQKAKKARDEFMEKNKSLSEDNDKLGTKVQKLEKDLVTAQEMLATFTEQKLKMSMQMDELKKDRKQLNQDLLSLNEVKDQFETENISLKRQYTRMIAENEDLINQLGETENRLKNAVALKTDINKLQENNEHIKLYCSNVTQEKMGVEEECKRLSQKIASMEKQLNVFQEYVGSKFGVNSSDVDSWISAVESRLNSSVDVGRTDDSNEVKIKLAEESEKCNRINSELQETLANLSLTVSERNDLQTEIKKFTDVNEQLRKELDLLNGDKDKMMNNLENMRIETRQLIESSEKLSEEIELLKYDKSKVETELMNSTEERNSMNTELNIKNNEIHKLNQHIDALSNDLSAQKSTIHSYEKSLEDFAKLQANGKELSDVNANLNVQIEKLNEHIRCSEEKLVKSDLELKRISESLEKSQSSENELKLELSNMSEMTTGLQNKLKEIECVNETNSSYLFAIEEKDRYSNVLKKKIENLKIAIENNDDSLSKQLESVKFEKEELKCLIDTLKEEAAENNAKLTQELSETQELLSQSLVREKKIFDEFKTKLIELHHNNDKITAEHGEIEKYCNNKCLEVEKLTQDLFDNQKKIEILENDLTLVNRQLGDVTDLLNEASKLNTKYEQDMKDHLSKLDELTNENETLKRDLSVNSSKNSDIESSQKMLMENLEKLNSELSVLREGIAAKDDELLKLKEELNEKTTLCNGISSKFEEVSSNYATREIELRNKLKRCHDILKMIMTGRSITLKRR